MDFIMKILTNPFLLTSLSSWFAAQVLKVLIHLAVNGKLVWERLVGDGGMPSGHSATVASLATISALRCGPDSVEFAICAILAIIVCHDATGVRQETGKQAVIINEIMKTFESLAEKKLPKVDLKEFVGHTPLQVAVGILIGIANGCLMHYWILNWLL